MLVSFPPVGVLLLFSRRSAFLSLCSSMVVVGRLGSDPPMLVGGFSHCLKRGRYLGTQRRTTVRNGEGGSSSPLGPHNPPLHARPGTHSHVRNSQRWSCGRVFLNDGCHAFSAVGCFLVQFSS